jgi:hypothetical protein
MVGSAVEEIAVVDGPSKDEGARPGGGREFRLALEELRGAMTLHRERVRAFMSRPRGSHGGDIEEFRQLHQEGDELFARFERLIHHVDPSASDRPAQLRAPDPDNAR